VEGRGPGEQGGVPTFKFGQLRIEHDGTAGCRAILVIASGSADGDLVLLHST
jgi:hypothetical protein